jgi:hypothetical protein
VAGAHEIVLEPEVAQERDEHGRSLPPRVAKELAATRRAGGRTAAKPLATSLTTETQAARTDPDESGRSLEWKRPADMKRPGHSAPIPLLRAPRTSAA